MAFIISPICSIIPPVWPPIPPGVGLADAGGMPAIPPVAGLAPGIGLADGGGIAIGLTGILLAEGFASGALGFWPAF